MVPGSEPRRGPGHMIGSSREHISRSKVLPGFSAGVPGLNFQPPVPEGSDRRKGYTTYSQRASSLGGHNGAKRRARRYRTARNIEIQQHSTSRLCCPSPSPWPTLGLVRAPRDLDRCGRRLYLDRGRRGDLSCAW